MMGKYGLPYMGSKNKIAPWVLEHLPKAHTLVDLFAGGCAVTHCALQSGKWQKVHSNDITDSAIFFKDVALGKYHDRCEWISREDFMRFKNSDPWIRLIYSFSCDQHTYLYGEEIEKYKEQVFKLLTGDSIHERRMAYRGIVREIERFITNRKIRPALDMEVLERIERLRGIQLSNEVPKLEATQADYRDVEILPDSVIFCDIPYRNTREYRNGTFDHDVFYEWAIKQTAPLFISEYWMPEDRFECVAEFERVSTFSATNNSLRKVERIFRPKTQL